VSYLIAMFVAFAVAVVGPRTAPPELHTYTVDRDASQLYVVVHRAGLLSFLGHDHAIVADSWAAELCLGSPIAQGAHASLTLETGSLVIDSDSARSLAGMDGGPDDDTRRDLQATFLDAEHLDASGFPEIRLELRAVEGTADDEVRVEGTITLHGITRDVGFPVHVQRTDTGTLLMTGTLRIRQRDFGIEPESKAGLVKVANEVDLQFALVASPTGSRCSAA
jgi:polyisoprenoid-binding protein YceI